MDLLNILVHSLVFVDYDSLSSWDFLAESDYGDLPDRTGTFYASSVSYSYA